METKLKLALGVSQVKPTGITGRGCISDGAAYETEIGMIFVKKNTKDRARVMFDGEYAGLQAISLTNTVRVPKPLAVFDYHTGSALAMEYIEMSSLRTHAKKLGEQIAKMHLHNGSLKAESTSVHGKIDDTSDAAVQPVDQYGFHTTTCCGFLEQDNTWNSDWVEFFAQQKLNKQLRLIDCEYEDREVMELWSQLQLKLPSFFQGITVTPSLLHGDLWSGNVAETSDGPVIYDPATFYGHSEFELSIADMFGGFPQAFHETYHKLIPKQNGFNKRRDLYQLFHNLNHWNHFGIGYRGSTMTLMRRLLNS